MTDPRKKVLVENLTHARNLTLQLLDAVPDDHLNPTLHPDFRPLRWHLGHIGMFESWWILEKAKGDPRPDEQLCFLFSTENPRSLLEDLPPRETVLAFTTGIREKVLDYLERVDLDEPHHLLHNGYIFENVICHELQHSETIAYELQMLPVEFHEDRPAESSRRPDERKELFVPSGEYPVGRMKAEPHFSYDNEWPRNTVSLEAYLMDEFPVTNIEFAEFLEDDGYTRRELWSPEGWRWRLESGSRQPLYWRKGDRGIWLQKSFSGFHPLIPDHPVMLISFHEAEAYAKYRKKRLPSEAEWEVAAAWNRTIRRQNTYAWGDDAPDDTRANYGNPLGWSEPVACREGNRSTCGCLDMTGNIWEWTSSPFEGYPGFRAYPYPDYSQQWFDGLHRVVRGGSFASQAPMLRTTFRNWFYPRTRERFIGVRLCRSA